MDGSTQGITRVLGREFDTTGVLGVSACVDGNPAPMAFPRWLTIPGHYSLAEARLWHFFFAWLLVQGHDPRLHEARTQPVPAAPRSARKRLGVPP